MIPFQQNAPLWNSYVVGRILGRIVFISLVFTPFLIWWRNEFKNSLKQKQKDKTKHWSRFTVYSTRGLSFQEMELWCGRRVRNAIEKSGFKFQQCE